MVKIRVYSYVHIRLQRPGDAGNELRGEVRHARESEHLMLTLYGSHLLRLDNACGFRRGAHAAVKRLVVVVGVYDRFNLSQELAIGGEPSTTGS